MRLTKHDSRGLLATVLLVILCTRGFSVGAAEAGSPVTKATGPGKPNILVIYTDDHGWADLGAQAVDRDIHTPPGRLAVIDDGACHKWRERQTKPATRTNNDFSTQIVVHAFADRGLVHAVRGGDRVFGCDCELRPGRRQSIRRPPASASHRVGNELYSPTASLPQDSSHSNGTNNARRDFAPSVC